MSASFLQVTAAQVLDAISTSVEKECPEYSSIFRKRDITEPGLGWDLLASIFGFDFRPSNPSEPFGAMFQTADRRSMLPSDLSEEQLTGLEALVGAVEDPEFQSRVWDVLWLRRNNANAARAAVEAYLKSGTFLEDPDNWVASFHRYERALRLARQVDSKGPLPTEILAHLEARVVHHNGTDTLYFTSKSLELLAEFRFGDFAKLAAIAGGVASRARAQGNFDRSRTYYGVQAKLLRNAKDADGAEAARVALAETFSEEAEQREQGGSALAAHQFWQQAINAFRERPSLRSRIPEIQRRLAKAGVESLGQMTTHTFEMDLSEAAEAAKKTVAGLPLEDALFAFVMLVRLIDPAALREEAIQHIRDHPLQSMMAAEIFDGAGRKVGVRPAASRTDPKQQEEAIAGFMEFLARYHRTPYVFGCIAPAMRQLIEEHDIDEACLEGLIGDSPLIQEDRKGLFLKGLAAGFCWDFSTALHLLIPQVEHGLRKMLFDLGVVPRNMTPEGVEEVWSYERILAQEVMRECLGASLVYELQSLLIARVGVNMRNLLAHGLASEAVLSSESGFYLWWILLRLIALPTPKMAAFLKRGRN